MYNLTNILNRNEVQLGNDAAYIDLLVSGCANNHDWPPLLIGENLTTGTWTLAAAYDPLTSSTVFTDGTRHWSNDQWIGSMINLSVNASQRIELTIIGNTASQIRVNGNIQTGNLGNPGQIYAIDDYRLASGSLNIDSGTSVAITNDFQGKPRPSGLGYDIGANEFQFNELRIISNHGRAVKYPDLLSYDLGTTVTVTVTPDEGYDFSFWTGDIPVGHENDNPLLIILDKRKCITAHYLRQTGTVLVNVIPETASWSFNDGEGWVHNGTGNKALTNVPTGQIVLNWGTLPGYDQPVPNQVTRSLEKDGNVTFREIYVSTSDDILRKEAQILRYLLGLDNDSTGLNMNGDGRVDVADLVYVLESRPPSIPSEPRPADNATTISVTTNLEWTLCQRGKSYDILLWKSSENEPTSPTASGLTTGSYDPPTTLTYATQYHWRVIAHNGEKASTGPRWSFTTKPQVIQILAPNGGEKWKIGTVVQIHWKVKASVAGTAVRLELWRGNGKAYDLGNDWSDTGENVKNITVPGLSPAGDYKVRVVSIWIETHGGGPDAYDETDGGIEINE